MLIPLKKMFRQNEPPVHWSGPIDLVEQDFPGYDVEGPVLCTFDAIPRGETLHIEMALTAWVCAPCARCLQPVRREQYICKTYDIRLADIEEEYPELPLVEGKLDLREMAYGELVMEVPSILLCREDCAGLCPRCGQPLAACICSVQEEGDPRWKALRDVWQKENE